MRFSVDERKAIAERRGAVGQGIVQNERWSTAWLASCFVQLRAAIPVKLAEVDLLIRAW
jgi:hypothetical protein